MDEECNNEYTDTEKIYLDDKKVVVNLASAFPLQSLFYVLEYNNVRWSLPVQVKVCEVIGDISLRDPDYTLSFELEY